MSDRVRRNGLMASCEPCRRSKLRCGHERPQCARCKRRGLSEQQCHYHPAPMAQKNKDARNVSHTPTAALSIVTDSATTPSVSSPNAESLDKATGIIGMHQSLQVFADSPQSDRTYAALSRTGLLLPGRSTVTASVINEGLILLENVSKLMIDDAEAVKFWQKDHPGAVTGSFLAKAVWWAIHNMFKDLGVGPSRSRLRCMSRAISEQTSRPLRFPKSVANGALEKHYSREEVRWDMIGLYCVITGCYHSCERTTSNVGPTPSERTNLARQSLYATTQCEAFCQQLESCTDLNLLSLAEACMLATWCFGDDSYHVFRIMGNFSTVIFALGYHRGSGNDPTDPVYIVELRKRAMALAHEHDKVLATFVGRPPRLNRHYCVAELPLDLADSVFVGSPEVLEAAKAKLDPNGWNTDGSIHTATRQRAQLLLSMIREEVLELTLGPEIPNLAHQARSVLSKLETTWQSFPHMKHSRLEWEIFQPDMIGYVAVLRLEYLYSKFLLHKLLVHRNESTRSELIHISYEILSLVLMLMKRKDFTRIDLEWVMVFYAMPCASVLLLELFRQCSQPHTVTILNRSTIIKDLYALISCCDWFLESGQSNYDICKQAQSIFSRGLGQLLDGHESTIRPGSRTAGLFTKENDPPDETLDLGVLGDFVQDPEWNAWLESFGLEGEQWLDFSVDITPNDP